MQNTLMQASHQWATRPSDERFVSLIDMQSHFTEQRQLSKAVVVANRQIHANPGEDNKSLVILGPNGNPFAPTNWAFGQLAQLAEAPAAYMRSLPSPLAADCINYGLQFKRDIEDVGLLLYKNGSPVIRAATGPKYGRIWNSDIVNGLVKQFGDGLTGDFRVPGEFDKHGATVDDFLAKRFGPRMVATIKSAHMNEEGRPIETLWDATTAVTAYARAIEYQDQRVELERQAGNIMRLAA